jgi:hypothetical protein
VDEGFFMKAMRHVGVIGEKARMTATTTWRQMLGDAVECGDVVSHAARSHAARSTTSLELVAHQTWWSMTHPVVTCPVRKVGRRFMAAEAAWIISGSNRLPAIEPYAKHLAEFSGDGLTLAGAYGPPFVDQLPYVVDCLKRDPQSRQAVATLWRPRPAPDPDIPCTIALQWLVRQGRLNCLATMRSSDMYLGVPYDVFSFSAMSVVVALDLKARGVEVTLGDLTLTAGSQHVYERDFDAVRACAACRDDPPSPALVLGAHTRDSFLERLWEMARGAGVE